MNYTQTYNGHVEIEIIGRWNYFNLKTGGKLFQIKFNCLELALIGQSICELSYVL